MFYIFCYASVCIFKKVKFRESLLVADSILPLRIICKDLGIDAVDSEAIIFYDCGESKFVYVYV